METVPSRRLAAILAADVVGYSQMMSADEARTLAALRALRDGVVAPAVAAHRGVIVKGLGDGWLVAFDSAAQAVRCALDVQDALGEAAEMRLRIGVHVGDVTHEDGDVYGDGVNLAARLEGVAPAGGVAVSDAARSALDGTLRSRLADSGLRGLKNIDGPVRVWTCGGPASAAAPEEERVSIAVLAFDAAGGAVAAPFAEGVAEDLATELARFRWIAVDERAAAANARYALGGAVRESGGRLRVTARLTHRPDDRRVWSERWEHGADDPFAAQDAVVAEIVARVCAELDAHEKTLARLRPVETLSPRELANRANGLLAAARVDAFDEAEALLDRAIALSPEAALLHVQKALALYLKALSGAWPLRESIDAALSAGRRALALDSRMANAHGVIAAAHAVIGETERALAAADRIETLNRNAWGAPHARALALVFAPAAQLVRRFSSQVEHAEALLFNAGRTLEMAPNSAYRAGHLFHFALGLLLRDAGGDISEAENALDRAASEPGASWWPQIFLALAALRRDDAPSAFAHIAEVRAAQPALRFNAVDALFGATAIVDTLRAEFVRLPELGLPRI